MFLQLTFFPFFFLVFQVGAVEGGGHFKQWSLGWSRLRFFFPNNLTLVKATSSILVDPFKARSSAMISNPPESLQMPQGGLQSFLRS